MPVTVRSGNGPWMGVDIGVTVDTKVGAGVSVGGIMDGCVRSYVSTELAGTFAKDRTDGMEVDSITIGVGVGV